MGRHQYDFDEAVDKIDALGTLDDKSVRDILRRTLKKDLEAVVDYALAKGWNRHIYTVDEAKDRLDSVAGTEYLDSELREILEKIQKKDEDEITEYARNLYRKGKGVKNE